LADILIRKVSDETKERLAEAAASAGASLESFLRDLLDKKAAETPKPNDEVLSISALAHQLFSDGSGEALADILDSLTYEPELIDDFAAG
jgi:plasmid stability protein